MADLRCVGADADDPPDPCPDPVDGWWRAVRCRLDYPLCERHGLLMERTAGWWRVSA